MLVYMQGLQGKGAKRATNQLKVSDRIPMYTSKPMSTEKPPVRKTENIGRKPEWLNRKTYDVTIAKIRSWPVWKQKLYERLINE